MTLKPFSCPYHYNGRDYTAEIYGHDPEDARARLRAAYFQGNDPEEIVARIPVPRWIGKMIGGQ